MLVKHKYRWPYVDSHILRDFQTKSGPEFNLRISTTFTEQKYFGLTKSVLLMAFQSDLGLKPIWMSAIFLQILLTSFCMACAKLWGALSEQFRLRKISIKKK